MTARLLDFHLAPKQGSATNLADSGRAFFTMVAVSLRENSEKQRRNSGRFAVISRAEAAAA
jgi:hypothetical protein